MLLRTALLIALVCSGAAEARVPARHVSRIKAAHAPVATDLRLTDKPAPDADSRWMLQPIVSDYRGEDRSGIRVKVRGARMKMKVPIDFY
jgi:hypothetical protein